MDADLTVDDELKSSEPTPAFGILEKAKAWSGVPTFIMSLTGTSGMVSGSVSSTTKLRIFIDVAGIALGAGDGHLATVGQLTSCGAGAATAGIPSSRAMMAAWHVRPPGW